MEEPPPIVHTPLPLHAVQTLPVLFFMTVFGIGMGAYVATTAITGGSPWLGTLLGVVTCGVFIRLGVLYKRSLRRRTIPRMNALEIDEDSQFPFVPELRHAAARVHDVPWRERQADCANAWQYFASESRHLGLKPPRTVIHSGLAKRLSALERPSHGMEPEPILDSGESSVYVAWLWVTGFAIVAAVQLSSANWFAGALMLFVAVIFAVGSTPSLRDRFRVMRWDDGNLVAGMGALKNVQRNRIWTVNDAVMIVRTKEPVGALFVRFVGEAGIQRLTFVDEHDPDFVKLWQRWNHPQPRPELMAEEAA